MRKLAFIASLAFALSSAVTGNAWAVGPVAPWATMPPPLRGLRPIAPASGSSILRASSDDELFADACPTPSACWAVGFASNGAGARLGHALLFDGTAWSSIPVPQPAGTSLSDYDYLDAVACTSRSDCWVVGSYGNEAGAQFSEILHWNGATWSQVASPQPAGTTNSRDHNQLNGVTCVSASDCWAVGDYSNDAGAYLNFSLHWNGERWKLVAQPDADGTAKNNVNAPYSVSCTSRADCVSVGYGHNSLGAYVNEALRWNGKAWRKVSIPQPGGTHRRDYGYLEGLACLSATECVAAGGYLNSGGAYVNEMQLWNGTSWTEMAVPEPDGSTAGDANGLTALSCLSASACWAVGYYDNAQGAELNQALEWNGEAWSSVPLPQPGGTGGNSVGNALYGVSCGSSSYCLAVGYTFETAGPSMKQLLLWNGLSWSVDHGS